MDGKDFVHLHLHTEYSLLDGAARIDHVFKAAKNKGMDTLAITDHGNMYGTLYFSEEAKKNGIKPIVGCEMYLCDDYTVKTGKADYDHLILLCKDRVGYKNLVKLNSIAFVDGFYYKPRIDYKTLAKYSEGLICLSACLFGRVSKRLTMNDYEGAKETAEMLHGIFGEDFYLEIQDHGLREQKFINPMLVKLSKEINVPLVATNDVHYIEREDAEMQEVVMCISMKKTLADPSRMRMESDQSYLKSPEEMYELFSYIPEALENTRKIADKCSGDIFALNAKFEPIKDDSLIPGYVPDNGQTPYEFLKDLAEKGLKERYPVITDEIRERFDYELNTIRDMGFIEYYLIVWDFINYARSVGIAVGAGRGSGVGSIIAYSVGITDVDPLKYSLIFERFLNRERVSMPDFDIDIADERRGEVVEYVRNKYGADKVTQIITFGTLAAKAAVKDVGRVFGVPYASVDRITKIMDGTLSLEQQLGRKTNKDGVNVGIKEFIDLYNEDIEAKRIIDMALKVEDLPRNTSMHAAGVVICAKTISDHIPLQRNGEDVTTQFDKDEVEQLGMLKMDFLGLRTLTDIQKAEQYIKENHGIELDFHVLGYDDPEVYGLIGEGNTDAVFQLESPGMKRFMMDLKPTTFEDIIAGISLYRPGPMDSIPSYIKYKHDPSSVKYKHPLLEPILKNTYGTLIYQEQVMQICQQLGGFSLGQADIVRKAMGKKKIDVMNAQKEYFVNGGAVEKVIGKDKFTVDVDGCVKKGVPKEVADDIWNEMANFAKYAFNKSHAAAYAVLAYQTAYLKRYYQPEFLTAILNDRTNKIEEITKYLIYLKKVNIPVYPPDINKSKTFFATEGDGIRFGLVAIKNVGLSIINQIVEERIKNGDFKSFDDFILRCYGYGINKRLVESLILAGAFDTFGISRASFMAVYEELMDRAQAIEKQKNSMQMSLFGDIIKEDGLTDVVYPDMGEYNSAYKLSKEKAVIGVYVSGHPLDGYMGLFENCSFNTSILSFYEEDDDGNKTYTEVKEGEYVTMGGIVASIDKRATKSGDYMGYVKIEDVYGQIEGVLFPKSYEKLKNVIQEESIVKISGRLQLKDNEVKILIDKAEEVELPTKKNYTGPQTEKWVIINLQDETAWYDILDVIDSYESDLDDEDAVSVGLIKPDGKKAKLNMKIRRCNGFDTELASIIGEGNFEYIERAKKNN